MRGLAIILMFQLAGEILVTLTGIPFPGRVLGLLLLWLALTRGWVAAESIEVAANFLLQNLTLFFTPIVVGAVVYREVLAAHWFAISLGLLLSTAAGSAGGPERLPSVSKKVDLNDGKLWCSSRDSLFQDLWRSFYCVYISACPELHRRYPSPVIHPLLISSLGIILFLEILEIDYSRYNQGGELISFFLGPAVALALPPPDRGDTPPGSDDFDQCQGRGSVAMVVAALVVKLLGGGPRLVLSMIPKSVTTPIAVEISAIIGGEGALTGVFVVLTGILGAMFGPEFLRVCGIRDEKAMGLALGTASHGDSVQAGP